METLEDARRELEHTRQFYAVRWAALRALIHEDALHIEDEACAIMANASRSPTDPPTFDQQMNVLRHERDASRAIIRLCRNALNLPPDRSNWKADLPAIVKTTFLQMAEAVCELRSTKLARRLDKATVRLCEEACLERDAMESALVELMSFAVTCRRENTDEWLGMLAERINANLESLGKPDRFQVDRFGDFVRVEGAQEEAEADHANRS